MKKVLFVNNHLPHATHAGETFGLNPLVILAQAALESGWGTSTLATEYHNYFGICGYGKPNSCWNGDTVTLKEGGILFRCYPDPQTSFMDYARLITSAYKPAAAVSYYPEAFAHEIAYSRYISEVNGDNRQEYLNALVALSKQIRTLISLRA